MSQEDGAFRKETPRKWAVGFASDAGKRYAGKMEDTGVTSFGFSKLLAVFDGMGSN